jgi:hypothetical protein
MPENKAPTDADRDRVLDPLPASVLLDIARNEAAPSEWRKAATKLLRHKGYSQANHPDLLWFVKDLEKEELAEREVSAIVESATEEEFVTVREVIRNDKEHFIVPPFPSQLDPSTNDSD